MSNFDFLNDSRFLSDPLCEKCYNYALTAESYYFADQFHCARNIRCFLETLCEVVSKNKQAQYPLPTQKPIGGYWYGKNREDFIRCFGIENFKQINPL